MSNRLHRVSVPDLVVNVLREGLGAGRWRHELPGEMALCRELNVSRITLRKAIEQLAREGWLELAGRGRHHRISRVTAMSSPPATATTIRVLTPYLITGSVLQNALRTLGTRVASAGYRLETECHPRLFESPKPAAFQRLGQLPDTAGWLLMYSTESIQRWFAESGHPCVICGRPYEGVQLSSVQPKPEIIARHAVGRFYSHGHRELAFLIAEVTSLSDKLIATAFQEEAHRLGVNAKIVRHGSAATSVSQAVKSLFTSTPRPTGIMSNCPEHCMTILCHMLGSGLRVPEDAAVICGWSDVCLDYTVPPIPHYRFDSVKLGVRLAAVFLDLLEHGAGKIRSVALIPEFVHGDSLAAIQNGGRQDS